MVYSFQPALDTTNFHGGFYFVAFLCAVFFIWMWKMSYEEMTAITVMPYVFIAVSLVLGVAGWVSWHPGPPPMNEKVVGKFEGYVAESESRKSGKNSTTTDHYVYARFRIDVGSILIKVDPQTPIPDNVILYRNYD